MNGDPGFYLFDNLVPGDYYLEFTLPVSSTFTTQGSTGSSDSADSDPDTTTGQTETFTLASGQYDDSWDTGIILPTGGLSLGNRVWYDNDNDGQYEPADSELGINGVDVNLYLDSDGDGIEDPDEVGISGITVTLYHDPDGDGLYDTVYGTTTTDSNGHYLFDNLPPGAYSVGVTGSDNAPHDVLGSDYAQTGDPDHFGTTGGNNDNYGNPVVIGPGDVFLNMDFGYQPTSAVLNSVGDTIWYDADGDGNGMSQAPVDGGAAVTQGAGGVADSADYGLSGVTVALIDDLNDNGPFDAGEPTHCQRHHR